MPDAASLKVAQTLLHKALYKIHVYETEKDFEYLLQAIGLVEDSLKCLKGKYGSKAPFDITIN